VPYGAFKNAIVVFPVCCLHGTTLAQEMFEKHKIYEAYPLHIERSVRAHDMQIQAAGKATFGQPYYLIVPRLKRWVPGSVVRVAFSGGNASLYSKIESAARIWIGPNAANLKLVFRDSAGHFLEWRSTDKKYSAQIRVSFVTGKNGGYWSLVGTDSIDRTISGGAASQASMNLESFDRELPGDWDGTVRHEFGHALGFDHEHQSPVANCDFRFNDDPGYVKTKDSDGWYKVDAKGRRPGLYTYLGGKANYWPPAKVDLNLREVKTTPSFLIGDFDKHSIMKYFYEPAMFVSGAQSVCYSEKENTELSPEDVAGVRAAYPDDPGAIQSIIDGNMQTLEKLLAKRDLSPVLTESLQLKSVVNFDSGP